jgi:hypothetical protein
LHRLASPLYVDFTMGRLHARPTMLQSIEVRKNAPLAHEDVYSALRMAVGLKTKPMFLPTKEEAVQSAMVLGPKLLPAKPKSSKMFLVVLSKIFAPHRGTTQVDSYITTVDKSMA